MLVAGTPSGIRTTPSGNIDLSISPDYIDHIAVQVVDPLDAAVSPMDGPVRDVEHVLRGESPAAERGKLRVPAADLRRRFDAQIEYLGHRPADPSDDDATGQGWLSPRRDRRRVAVVDHARIAVA